MNGRTSLGTAAALPFARAAEPDSLRAHAESLGLIYGAAASYNPLQRDAEYASHFTRECAEPENSLKWGSVYPGPVRALPLDREYRRKPALTAMVRAFDGAGKRV